MTSYGIHVWDGGTCTTCVEQDPYADNGVDEDTPCSNCGWHRGHLSGERYPPGYNATSWRYATERIAELREEFPQFPKEMIAATVRRAGEDDMEGEKARDALTCTLAAKKMAEEHPTMREGSDPGPVPVALACIGLISSDKILEMCMDKRTDAFLDEVARVGADPVSLGISIAVIWNLDMARLQVSSRFIDGEMNIVDTNIVDTNMILMQTISENPHLQRMIHPLDGGAGDLPPGARRRVVFTLGEFFQKARDRNNGISSMTCGRATLWLHNEQEWKDKLIAANDGGRMMIMPSTQYMFA